MTTTFTIAGGVTGGLWWPIGAPAYKSCNVTFTRDESQHRPFGPVYAPDLLAMVDYIDLHEAGDFSSALRFTNDTVLIARREVVTNGRRIVRESWRPLVDFASVADRVARDVESFDFSEYEED